MYVKDIMNKDVKTITGDSTVMEAAEEMKKYRIGSLVVVKNSKLTGILTERDIMDKVVAEAADSSKLKVKDIMTTEVAMIDPEKDIGEAAQVMSERVIKKLPVIKGNKLVGIVTATDLCMAEPKMLEQIGALFLMPKEKKTIAG